MRHGLMRYNRIMVLTLAMFLYGGSMCTSVAADAFFELPAQKTASYEVTVQYPGKEAEDEKTPVPGVTLALYRVAVLTEDGSYEFVPELMDAELGDLTVLSASELDAAADLAVSYIDRESITPYRILTTDDAGKVLFGEIEEFGYYLTRQTGAGQSEDEDLIDPFFVQIPQYTETSGWIYEVTAEPKIYREAIPEETPGASITPPAEETPSPTGTPTPSVTTPPPVTDTPPTITPPSATNPPQSTGTPTPSGKTPEPDSSTSTSMPKTGDTAMPLVWAGILIASGIGLLGLRGKKR